MSCLRYQPKTEQKTFATMCYVHWWSFLSYFGRYLDQLKKYHIRFLNDLLMMMMMIIIMSIFASKHLPVFA